MTKHRAFNLLELMTTILVAGILASVTIGLAQANRNRVATEGAQRGIDAVIASQQQFASVYGAYTPFPADLTGLGNRVTVVATAVTEAGPVAIAVGDGGTLGVATVGPSGCRIVRVNAPAVVAVTTTSIPAPVGPCDPAAALPVTEAARPATGSVKSCLLNEGRPISACP